MQLIPAENIPLVFAPEYLGHFPKRGRPFHMTGLGLTFHSLRDCVVLSAPTQVIMPLHGAQLPCIFLESCPYVANEQNIVGDMHKTLARLNESGQPLVELPEAAPFYPPGATNFWHWTTESLPKLLALEESGYSGAYIVPYGNQMVRESLAMHSIAHERIYYNNASYHVHHLWLPPRLSGFWLAENMPLSAFLRGKILAATYTNEASRAAATNEASKAAADDASADSGNLIAPSADDICDLLPPDAHGNLISQASSIPAPIDANNTKKKRCYIRRIAARRILNEDELFPILDEFGFERMTPEELPLIEQYRYMRDAECSIMAHGANSTLTIVQPPRSSFIELFSNRYVSYNHLHSVRLLKLRYHAVVEDLDRSVAPNPAISTDEYFSNGLKADLWIDPTHIRILLESIFGV